MPSYAITGASGQLGPETASHDLEQLLGHPVTPRRGDPRGGSGRRAGGRKA